MEKIIIVNQKNLIVQISSRLGDCKFAAKKISERHSLLKPTAQQSSWRTLSTGTSQRCAANTTTLSKQFVTAKFLVASFAKWLQLTTALQQQPKRLDDHMPTSPAPLTAAQRRAILANAHAKYFSSRKAQDDAIALGDALRKTDYMAATDLIADVQMDSTTIVITIDADNFRETIELDSYGNTLKGTV